MAMGKNGSVGMIRIIGVQIRYKKRDLTNETAGSLTGKYEENLHKIKSRIGYDIHRS